jgi:hypothetical protein
MHHRWRRCSSVNYPEALQSSGVQKNQCCLPLSGAVTALYNPLESPIYGVTMTFWWNYHFSTNVRNQRKTLARSVLFFVFLTPSLYKKKSERLFYF